MTSYSPRKFQRQFDLDLIIASNASIAIGDMVWDAAGIAPPKFDRPGAPRNIYSALEVIGKIDSTRRKQLQDWAASIELVEAGMPNIGMHVEGEHAGDFQYPQIVNVAAAISLDKISSFNFSNLRSRVMPPDLRIETDKLLEAVKREAWQKYDMTIRRSHIITELIYGSISVSLDMKVASDVDIAVLTSQGFTLKNKNTVHRVETYSMDAYNAPFAMRTELARRFAS